VDALLAVGEALGAKDAYTGRHSRRVSAFAEAIGRELGLRARELDDLRMAGQLHDVGKIGIPDKVLGKEGPLDDEEYGCLKEHPVIGDQILGGTTSGSTAGGSRTDCGVRRSRWPPASWPWLIRSTP
jgi:HD-GYP domain-containing protein (c-di-GMP phosphodiesterase class II)